MLPYRALESSGLPLVGRVICGFAGQRSDQGSQKAQQASRYFSGLIVRKNFAEFLLVNGFELVDGFPVQNLCCVHISNLFFPKDRKRVESLLNAASSQFKHPPSSDFDRELQNCCCILRSSFAFRDDVL
jgi:hypothetical protein